VETELAYLRDKLERLETLLDKVIAAVKEHGIELSWVATQVADYPPPLSYRSSRLPDSVYTKDDTPVSERKP
jgi:hypothetical protein